MPEPDGDRAGDPGPLLPLDALPAAVRERLGEAGPSLERYARLLAGEGVLRGVIGPREVGRLWERHLLNSLAPVELVPAGAAVLDLGSGAGLPGVVWAAARPDLRVELVEPLLRRTTWLDEVVDALGLSQVTVTRARAEELAGRREVDVVTARAVAPLDRLAGWALPLLRPGGELLALKGAAAADELTAAAPALARLGTTGASILHPGAEWLAPPPTVVRVVAGARGRRPGVTADRPAGTGRRGGRRRS